MEKRIVMKIGGSVLYDKFLNINYELLDKVRDWYKESKEEYEKIVLIIGGGALSRDMQGRIKEDMDQEYLHNIGMTVTQTNAALLQGFLNDTDVFVPNTLGEAFEYLVEDGKKVLLSGGLKSGWSTDMDAAVFADIISVDRIFKLSDINYVYDKDPKEFEDAKPLKDISWGDYFSMFNITDGDVHKANGKIPIDVGCAQFSKNKDLSFVITGGESLYTKESIKDILTDGTFIHP
ncbi:hypothetical protein GYA44_01810 [Candidatus Microgenomates bacterium]|nr:hypothetical protein [Candidatus Microgenomates bacterium]